MKKEKVQYTNNDYYNHLLTFFIDGLKLVFGLEKEIDTSIIDAFYNSEENKYFLEIEFSEDVFSNMDNILKQ